MHKCSLWWRTNRVDKNKAIIFQGILYIGKLCLTLAINNSPAEVSFLSLALERSIGYMLKLLKLLADFPSGGVPGFLRVSTLRGFMPVLCRFSCFCLNVSNFLTTLIVQSLSLVFLLWWHYCILYKETLLHIQNLHYKLDAMSTYQDNIRLMDPQVASDDTRMHKAWQQDY
jgi:hypothetical protein